MLQNFIYFVGKGDGWVYALPDGRDLEVHLAIGTEWVVLRSSPS